MEGLVAIMPVYILNEELLRLTEEAIDSLGKINLIVIDNASPVGGGFLRSKASIYIRNEQNLGFARAVNQGLKLTDARYIAIANNDIRVGGGWRDAAKEIFKKESVYSCHFRMLNYDDPLKCGDKVFIQGRERWCTSSFFVINTSQLKFYFDENYGIGGYEDYDYWYTVLMSGMKTAYTTRACYQHRHSSTQNILSQDERSERDKKSIVYFKNKWGEEPENIFKKMYPEQWGEDYYSFFKVL